MQGGRENRYPVVGQEKCVEPSEKRKVAKSNEGVVRKVDGVMLVLWDLSDVPVEWDQHQPWSHRGFRLREFCILCTLRLTRIETLV